MFTFLPTGSVNTVNRLAQDKWVRHAPNPTGKRPQETLLLRTRNPLGPGKKNTSVKDNLRPTMNKARGEEKRKEKKSDSKPSSQIYTQV